MHSTRIDSSKHTGKPTLVSAKSSDAEMAWQPPLEFVFEFDLEELFCKASST